MARSSTTSVRGVDCFWESAQPSLRVERVLPTGRAQIVIDLDSGSAILVGPRTVDAVVEIPRRSAGFSLSGTGLAHIVGRDAHLLVDSTADLNDVAGSARLDIDLERNLDTKVRDLAQRLVARYEVDDRIVLAESLLRSGMKARSASVQVGLDRRTFVPAFRELVGVAPKEYELLVRFQRANTRMRSGERASLASIAAELGFADQSHLTRDFRRFAGVTPTQLQALPPGSSNHVPVDFT